jgi:hypothetical protein
MKWQRAAWAAGADNSRQDQELMRGDGRQVGFVSKRFDDGDAWEWGVVIYGRSSTREDAMTAADLKLATLGVLPREVSDV